MVIDFSKLGDDQNVDTVLDPREIFFALPNKDSRYAYPRDVQGQVWEGWFRRRFDRDVAVKMNTGAGKTVVGLLILKSCLNERVGPALYVAPDNYLVAQVISEAERLGLAVTEDVRAAAFLRGEAIGVVNIYKLLNGRSVFGVADEGVKIKIGSVVIDDAHACLATAEEQFTIRADSGSDVYDRLLEMFREDLRHQGEARLLDIEQGLPGTNMLVPFWTWQNKINKVTTLLHRNRDDDGLKFTWPLLKDVLPLCQCSFGGGTVEIATRCTPIEAIPSFADARRRIFMTATLADDGVLVTHFDVDIEAAEMPITPGSASDLGERMILIPQELNPALDDEDVRDLAGDLSKQHNVVVIVPSKARAALWSSRADATVDASNLEQTVEALKVGHVGLVVLMNKYDGVDLPDAACRVLILDGLPDVRRKLDRLDAVMLRGSSLQATRMVQRLEQGMGRGIRSAEDYCAVLLMGRSLTGQMYLQGAEKFTPATRAQYHLSQEIAKQLQGADAHKLKDAVNLLIQRDANWVRAAKGALVGVRYVSVGIVGGIAKAQRAAFNSARSADHQTATAALQDVTNGESDPRTRGWLRMQLAERTQPIDASEAQQIVQKAVSENPGTLLPLIGITYERLRASTGQAEASLRQLAGGTPIELMIRVHDILDRLQFIPDTAHAFEEAMKELGLLLGFGAQRPEAEFGSGPDVLWHVAPTKYFVIECKNGATSNVIAKSDVDQLAGSLNWFKERYGAEATAVAALIHPRIQLGQGATAPKGMRVITREKLDGMKQAVQGMCGGIGSGTRTRKAVEDALTFHKLSASVILDAFSVSPQRGRR